MEYQIIAKGDPHLYGINCGVVYGQNAHPAGPSSWAAYQVPDRTLRWLENEEYILPLVNTTNGRYKLQDIGFEQSVYNDAIWSTVSGQPTFAHSLRPESNPEAMVVWESYHFPLGPGKLNHITVRASFSPPAGSAIITVENDGWSFPSLERFRQQMACPI